MTALATFEHVQSGFEKPIPTSLKPKVEVFLGRASRRLHLLVPKLAAAVEKALAESDYNPSAEESETNEIPTIVGFARDMIVQAAENKLRNFSGYSSESAGVFSVTREDWWAKGRVDFAPEDLRILNENIDDTFGAVLTGPIRTSVPPHRWP
ncbi:head-to-tail adaptor [Gordonia phage Emianna]|uniref:Head-to-tail adaptor n=3 Tax=Foxborovirus TaxID=2948710 RepID=A0A385UGZ1_9CAUD|nr:head-to-tail adaptor [Gordonia phage NatB6]YP_010098288.1 head-to-tail adaptor [Gordonia phage Foxboro]YP_010098919.1 head-to-tail adaptor [Gordonia phage Emianna]AYD84145.1 head-to-tail adaptor [Gordonia phage Jifall16]AYD84303.1 head-to-tail adaptor [Gordonia phage Kurt]QZD98874.1 head-to-tail adaptor [Gordonia phage Tracker]AXH50311.1 head-to-tail adaptor [Gordonia phage NatB6]AYB69154.1 head-to-tail adaptor [Gordonia phage Foxboro]